MDADEDDMSLEVLKQIDAALGQQQILNVHLAKSIIEIAKLLPADDSRLPLMDALQSVADGVTNQNVVLVTLREMMMVEAGNAE